MNYPYGYITYYHLTFLVLIFLKLIPCEMLQGYKSQI